MNARVRRELLIVVGAVALASLFFLDKPFHMDEPLFLAPARHIVVDPLHPFDLRYNWYGREVPMATINNTPPLMLYALAAAWKLTGGAEWAMRLLFLPVNLLAAAALYLLAGLFLAEPLWPALILCASPAYLINMNLLYPETLALALGLWGLYALVRSEGGKKSGWFWASAGLCGAAVFSKYGAVFLVPTAAYHLFRRGARVPRILAWCAAALAPIAAYLLYDRLTYRSAVGSAWSALSLAGDMPYSRLSHKLRSLLAFAGGACPAAAAWGFCAQKPKAKPLLVLGGLAAVLFLPAWDLAPVVRSVDRVTGFLLAFGALAGLRALYASEAKGRDLWLSWTACALAVQAFLYWSVLARIMLFMLPPFVFALAEALERGLGARRRRLLYAASLALTLPVTAALAAVDARYAQAQRAVAAAVAAEFPGRPLWCAAHWGLQFYMEKAGARELDWTRGGWDEAAPGSVVVVPAANSNVLKPERRVLSNVKKIVIEEGLPVRLISAFGGEGGFYSSATGFLPYSLSREPLDAFDLVEILPP